MIDIRVGDIWEHSSGNTYAVMHKTSHTVSLFDLKSNTYDFFYTLRAFSNKLSDGKPMWKPIYQYKPD